MCHQKLWHTLFLTYNSDDRQREYIQCVMNALSTFFLSIFLLDLRHFFIFLDISIYKRVLSLSLRLTQFGLAELWLDWQSIKGITSLTQFSGKSCDITSTGALVIGCKIDLWALFPNVLFVSYVILFEGVGLLGYILRERRKVCMSVRIGPKIKVDL